MLDSWKTTYLKIEMGTVNKTHSLQVHEYRNFDDLLIMKIKRIKID